MDITKYQKLDKTKYIYYFYYLMCPKTRELHLKKYKESNIPVPEYLNENKLMNYINDDLLKLTKNINKKYINQKYLLLLEKKSESKIETFYKNSININIILILTIIIIIIYKILNKSF